MEVKFLFDCSLQKHYPTTAHDWDKLLKVRAAGFSGDLFLACFFLQLPNYSYPRGKSVRSGKAGPGRERWIYKASITDQLGELMKCLPASARGAQVAFLVKPLGRPSPDAVNAMVERFCANFVPESSWEFDAASHLRGAVAGFGIWRIP